VISKSDYNPSLCQKLFGSFESFFRSSYQPPFRIQTTKRPAHPWR
jgi:hypothetical protein